jgi:hypothetical protein
MNRFWGQTLSVAVLAVAAGSAVPACAHDDASLFVHGVLAPPPPSGNQCIYTADPTAAHISRGIVDGALRKDYSPEFLVGNTLIARGNPATPNSETARIEVQGAIVQVVDPKTNAQIENNTVLTSAIVEPASGAQPSYTALNASVMNENAIAHFAPTATPNSRQLALVYVTFFGQTLGGQSIQSNQYQFPVDVCFGCLVTVPPGAPSGYCQGKLPLASSDVACELGQDQLADCQSCYTCKMCSNQILPACNLTP